MNNSAVLAWLEQLEAQLPRGAKDSLQKAHTLVVEVAGEQGVSIEPLLEHARGVVEILVSLHVDADPLIAAFFCNIPQVMLPTEKLQATFGEGVARLVEGVHQLRIVDEHQERAQQAADKKSHLEGLRKLLLGMAQDVRVVLIKLAERVQSMRELKTMPEEARRRVARETMDIFAPLANRLGIWQLKWELEDLSFRFLEPEDYQHIAKLLDERRTDRENYIVNAVDILRKELKKANIEGKVAGRPKHIYSIWRKMKGKNVDFHDLFDVRAIRVLVDDVAACYAVLGLVHSCWHPIRSEFDDYIASPKGNMYQSLHTAVVGPEGKNLEIQIRTHDMHQHSEYGVAAHWGYKEDGRHNDVYREKIAWLRQILEWNEEEACGSQDTEDFIDRFKSEVFQDRVYVLTPKGKVEDLPLGATPLDFAYHIHTDVGHQYRGAKVNGRIVPIGYQLKNGEQVEILTAKNSTPSRDWLNPHLGYLHSSRTRAKVRSWFRQQDYENNVADGRNIVERELHRLGVSDINLDQLAKRWDYKMADDFFSAIGCGDISSAQIAGRLAEQVLSAESQSPDTYPQKIPQKNQALESAQASEICIMGVGDLMTHLARCCKPVPYDPIEGYITRGRGITVHRRDCRNLLRLEKEESERLVEVEWSHATSKTYSVDIYVRAYDRQGLLHDVTEILSNNRLNVMAVNTLTERKTHIANMTLTIDVIDVEQLSRALVKIEQLPNVTEASRKCS